MKRMMASAAGEDADHVGPPANFLIEADSGLLLQICRQTSRGNAVKGQDVLASLVQVRGRGRQLGLQRGDNVGVLSADRGRVRLLEDGGDQCRYPRLGGLGHLGKQVAMVVRLMPTA
jgi:hypothetical protein